MARIQLASAVAGTLDVGKRNLATGGSEVGPLQRTTQRSSLDHGCGHTSDQTGRGGLMQTCKWAREESKLVRGTRWPCRLKPSLAMGGWRALSDRERDEALFSLSTTPLNIGGCTLLLRRAV